MPELSLALGAAMAAAVAAGVLRGFTGFGSGMLLAPVLSVLFGPQLTVPTVVGLELLVTVQLLPVAIRQSEWRFIAPAALAAVVGLPVGIYLLVTVDSGVMTRAIAGIVIVFAAIMAFGWRYRGAKRWPITLGVSGFSGAMMGATSLGGPAMVLYLLSGPDGAAANRANMIAWFAVAGPFLALLLYLNGVVGAAAAWHVLLLAPGFLIGSWLGARYFRHSSERLYRNMAFLLLFAAGLFGLLH